MQLSLPDEMMYWLVKVVVHSSCHWTMMNIGKKRPHWYPENTCHRSGRPAVANSIDWRLIEAFDKVSCPYVPRTFTSLAVEGLITRANEGIGELRDRACTAVDTGTGQTRWHGDQCRYGWEKSNRRLGRKKVKKVLVIMVIVVVINSSHRFPVTGRLVGQMQTKSVLLFRAKHWPLFAHGLGEQTRWKRSHRFTHWTFLDKSLALLTVELSSDDRSRPNKSNNEKRQVALHPRVEGISRLRSDSGSIR